MPDPNNPLALLLAAVVVMGSVVAFLFRTVVASLRAHIRFLEDRIQIGDQREEAWHLEATRQADIHDRTIHALQDAVAEVKRLRAADRT